jgi:hypothetical protein
MPTIRCECLFCDEVAVARVTVPHHKPQTLMCEADLGRQLEWAAPYRHVLGMVVVEPLP